MVGVDVHALCGDPDSRPPPLSTTCRAANDSRYATNAGATSPYSSQAARRSPARIRTEDILARARSKAGGAGSGSSLRSPGRSAYGGAATARSPIGASSAAARMTASERATLSPETLQLMDKAERVLQASARHRARIINGGGSTGLAGAGSPPSARALAGVVGANAQRHSTLRSQMDDADRLIGASADRYYDVNARLNSALATANGGGGGGGGGVLGEPRNLGARMDTVSLEGRVAQQAEVIDRLSAQVERQNAAIAFFREKLGLGEGDLIPGYDDTPSAAAAADFTPLVAAPPDPLAEGVLAPTESLVAAAAVDAAAVDGAVSSDSDGRYDAGVGADVATREAAETSDDSEDFLDGDSIGNDMAGYPPSMVSTLAALLWVGRASRVCLQRVALG